MDADLTRLPQEWRQGDRAAEERLIRLVYADLRSLAAAQLARE